MEWINPQLRKMWPRFWPDRDPEQMFRDVSERVEAAIEVWELTPIERIDKGWVAVVVRCERDGEPLVLKISPPHIDRRNEALMGQEFAGDLFVPVIETRDEAATLLMVCADPGEPLDDYDSATQIQVCGRLALALANRSLPSPAELRSYDELVAAETTELERVIDGAAGAMRFAEACTEELRGWPRSLLHGDLHSRNVLSHQGEWRLIDGKGWSAPLMFEARCLFDNPAFAAGDDAIVGLWAESLRVSTTDAWIGLAARARTQITSLPLGSPTDRAYGSEIISYLQRAKRAVG